MNKVKGCLHSWDVSVFIQSSVLCSVPRSITIWNTRVEARDAQTADRGTFDLNRKSSCVTGSWYVTESPQSTAFTTVLDVEEWWFMSELLIRLTHTKCCLTTEAPGLCVFISLRFLVMSIKAQHHQWRESYSKMTFLYLDFSFILHHNTVKLWLLSKEKTLYSFLLRG